MKRSEYKTEEAKKFVENWIDSTMDQAALNYEKIDVETSFGKTRVLAINHHDRDLKPVIYVPGARTCGAFLALSGRLNLLSAGCRIYLLDVNGQIGLSDGACPPLKDTSYGIWLDEVCRGLEIERGVFAGASFGGQLIMKFAAIAPERIEKIVLLNPIGFSNISFAPGSLYRTLVPLIFPSRVNIDKFLAAIVFGPRDGIGAETKKRVGDFMENAIRNFRFGGEYPSRMADAEIEPLAAIETHLILGRRDGLIPHEKTIKRAEELLSNLKSVHICDEQAHGIEVSGEAIAQLQKVLQI